MLNRDTGQSGMSTPSFYFLASCADASMSGLLPLGEEAWVTASNSLVKLDNETLIIGCTVFIDNGRALLDSDLAPR